MSSPGATSRPCDSRPRRGRRRVLRSALIAALVPALVPVLVAAAPPDQVADDAGRDEVERAAGVRGDQLPEPARRALPLVSELIAQQCPELPPVWVLAQVQAESGWDADLSGDHPDGPAGLYQFGRVNWEAAGGRPWPDGAPRAQDAVLSAETHLQVAVPWVCANLRAVSAHLADTGKPTTPLDAMLVCHIAGCGRVTASATGLPRAGEAGCGERCAEVVRRYVAAVHANVERYQARAEPPDDAPPPEPAEPPPSADPPPAEPPPTASEPGPPAPTGPAPPAPWTGGATACRPPDPTRADGCLTGAARHGLAAVEAAFGGWTDGPTIRSAGCWDAHAWNPRSDHPKGRACDFFPGAPGAFPDEAQTAAGWAVADYLRTHHEPLKIRYLIWHGRYWSPRTADDGGWGKRYSGAGVYDVRDATGGHFDHIHVSFLE